MWLHSFGWMLGNQNENLITSVSGTVSRRETGRYKEIETHAYNNKLTNSRTSCQHYQTHLSVFSCFAFAMLVIYTSRPAVRPVSWWCHSYTAISIVCTSIYVRSLAALSRYRNQWLMRRWQPPTNVFHLLLAKHTHYLGGMCGTLHRLSASHWALFLILAARRGSYCNWNRELFTARCTLVVLLIRSCFSHFVFNCKSSARNFFPFGSRPELYFFFANVCAEVCAWTPPKLTELKQKWVNEGRKGSW